MLVRKIRVRNVRTYGNRRATPPSTLREELACWLVVAAVAAVVAAMMWFTAVGV
jgi:hypothetical protein